MTFIKPNRLAVSTLMLLALSITAILYGLYDHPHQVLVCGFREDKVVDVNGQKLSTEVVATTDARNKGLSGRECMAKNQAMLFEFNKPGQYPFWMKDMRFPIDMVWINAEHRVVVIQENVEPSTYPDRFVNPPTVPAQYVLELQAYRTRSLPVEYGALINF